VIRVFTQAAPRRGARYDRAVNNLTLLAFLLSLGPLCLSCSSKTEEDSAASASASAAKARKARAKKARSKKQRAKPAPSATPSAVPVTPVDEEAH